MDEGRTDRQKPAVATGQEEEEAAAARFLGPLQLAQLPDLPTLRVCTYLYHLPILLPDYPFVCERACAYVFRPYRRVSAATTQQPKT